MKQITRFSINQTSKVFAIMYAVMGIFHFIIGIGILFFAKNKAPGIFFLFMPLIMGVFGYLGIALFSWFYNIIASKVGGIEFELTEVE